MPPQTFLLLPGSFTHSLTHSFNKHFFCGTYNMPSTGEGYHSELNKRTSCPHGAYNLVKSYKLRQMIRRKRSVSYGSILKGGPLSPGGHKVPVRMLWFPTLCLSTSGLVLEFPHQLEFHFDGSVGPFILLSSSFSKMPPLGNAPLFYEPQPKMTEWRLSKITLQMLVSDYGNGEKEVDMRHNIL